MKLIQNHIEIRELCGVPLGYFNYHLGFNSGFPPLMSFVDAHYSIIQSLPF